MRSGKAAENREGYSASVIVPVYGAAGYLEKCVDSLLEQDYDNYNIILVDDLSTDGSLQIAEAYAQRHPEKISLIRNSENIGQGRSRMKAVSMTEADYILFVDSDDYVAKDYISTFMAANGDNYDLIVGGYTRDTDGKLRPVTIPDSPYTLVLYAVACCKMIRREFLIRNGIDFTESRKGEDIYFNSAVFSCKPKYRIIPSTGYFYRLNRASTTKSMNHKVEFEKIVMDMFAQLRDKFGSREASEETQSILQYAYAANIANALIIYNHGCGIRNMREKLKLVNEDIRKNYPGMMEDKTLRFTRPKAVSLKIRTGVGAFYWSKRLHLQKCLFYLVAMI